MTKTFPIGTRCKSELTGEGDIRVVYPDGTYKLMANKGWFHVDHKWAKKHTIESIEPGGAFKSRTDIIKVCKKCNGHGITQET